MIKVYVHGNLGPNGESFTCSDHSKGDAVIQKQGPAKVVDFEFSKHSHPSFWLPLNRFRNGQEVTVDLVNQVEHFDLQVD